MTRGNVLLTVTLAVAAAASWLWLYRNEDPVLSGETIESTDLGYYLDDASLVGVDAEGRALYTLRAERIEQHPQRGSVSMEKVTIEYDEQTETPWTASADTAHVPASGDPIELEGNVRLTRANANGRNRLEIAVPRLELEVAARIARTSDPVALTQGADTVRAIGLEADLRRERFRLLSEVRAELVEGRS
jgi:LPS export ABC transporter protein LptC